MYQPAKTATTYTSLFTKKDILFTTIISLSYLLLAKILIGFKVEQVVIVLIFNSLYYASFPTRKFITGFSVFIVFWIIFDSMKAFPNYMYNTVHIGSLYNAEKSFFGIHFQNQIVTPNEFWRQNTNTFFDIISGVFYLCWVPVPLIFAGYLFFKNREQFMHFSLTFLFVNIIGFIIYYIYPAAPPWYVQHYGFQFIAHTPGNTAGLQRFDNFFHAGIFNSLYAKSSNVFAAMPSLHSSYPLITLYYGIKNRLGAINIVFAIIMFGIWFAAVYSSHHYILDVLAGITCAIAGIIIFQKWIAPNGKFHATFVEKFVND
ncbi:phosphatase PAP2 family protein [Segetibacter koreensis]|uniref:phosphatase PAP2 family protein n=1 Tax=Segetibacter koreensis TaxID=398037 RepID=UPI0003609ACF|nr:phosphatase PAP2 family protein [Segetibacter koreensis]